MGDSGALLLGFTLAVGRRSQGMLKTAALTSLVLPLLVLAVPLLDTSFVVARRIKHGQPVYVADRQHLHHRFEAVGFSQRRAVVYLYGWCADAHARRARDATSCTRTRTASGTGRTSRSTPRSALLAIGASVYIVYLLEIVKLANPFIRRREELARARAAQDRVADRARTTCDKVARFARNQATFAVT